MIVKNRFGDIDARLIEIRTLGENATSEELDTLTKESTSLIEERTQLLADVEKRTELLKGIADGTVETKSVEEPKGKTKMEILTHDSPEYRTLWLKNLQGAQMTEVEQRDYTSATASVGASIPTATSDILFSKMTKIAPMLSEITLLRVAGNVSFSAEGVRNAAAQHTQNVAITAATDTMVAVSLTGYEFNKLLYVSKTVQTMSINAFEGWLVDMIGEDIAVAIEDQIINGTGSTAPKGIAAVTYTSGTNLVVVTGTYTITYSDVVNVISQLPARYDANAKIVCSKAMVYQGLASVKDTTGRPILINDATGAYPFKVLGYPVIISDKVAAKTLYLGDFKKIVGNLAQNVTVEKDASAGFASNSIAYRGGAIFDCTIALTDAFVKLTTLIY